MALQLSEDTLYPVLGALLSLLLYYGYTQLQESNKKSAKDATEELFKAAMVGDMEACQDAIDAGAVVKTNKRPGKKTPLHAAAQHGHTEVIEWLIEDHKCPVDVPDFSLMRPLHYAAMKGKTTVCKMLIRLGASPHEKDTAEYTCMHFAAQHGYEETLEVLKRAGGDVNGRDKAGHTPMMLAALKGKAAAVEWLLNNGGDKFCKQQQEATAYDFALRRKHKSVIALLEGKPAKVVTQASRQHAESILQAEVAKEPVKIPASVGATKSDEDDSDDDSYAAKKKRAEKKKARGAAAKKKLENQALKMAKDTASGKMKSQRLAGNLNKASLGGGFSADFNPKDIKENFPDAWKRAAEEIGEEALESLLDTVE